MRFFTDDGGRSTSALWTWRSTTVVMVLALVSSLAVGLGAAGGLSVLDEPGISRPASPPLADSRPPVPLPLDPEPPPVPNTADDSAPKPPGGTDTDTDRPETVDVRQEESGPTGSVPEVDDEVDDAGDVVDDTVEGTWTATDGAVEGTWTAVEGGFTTMSVTGVLDWDPEHCQESYQSPSLETEAPSWDTDSDWGGEDPSETDWSPSWDTEYSDLGGYER